jgi:diacylglycerol kinase family enzyme
MCKQALIVYNPAIRSASDRDLLLARITRELCEECGYFVTLFAMDPQKQVRDLVPLLNEPVDLVVALGGDGTTRFALAALAESGSNIPLGIVPLGTANVLARNLGILDHGFFASSPENALSVLKSGRTISIDLGSMNGAYFAVTAAVGPMSDAFTEPNPLEKNAIKLFAYARTMIKTIIKPPRLFKITLDGISVKILASGVFVSNVEDLGLCKPPDISELTDGLLSLNILTPHQFKDYVDIGFRFAVGHTDANPPNYVRKVKEVLVEMEPIDLADSKLPLAKGITSRPLSESRAATAVLQTEIPAMIDGEEFGTTPIHVKVIPQAVRVLVPENSLAV